MDIEVETFAVVRRGWLWASLEPFVRNSVFNYMFEDMCHTSVPKGVCCVMVSPGRHDC